MLKRYVAEMGVALVVLFLFSGCATTRPGGINVTSMANSQTTNSSSAWRRTIPDDYYLIGAQEADADYSGSASFTTGVAPEWFCRSSPGVQSI